MSTTLDQERIEEWHKLERLVNIAGGLNHGNNIVAKIAELESLHDRLTCADIRSPRASLMGWLHQVMIEKSQEMQAADPLADHPQLPL